MDETDEAKIKLQAHPQRAPDAGNGAESGADKWFAEGTGKELLA